MAHARESLLLRQRWGGTAGAVGPHGIVGLCRAEGSGQLRAPDRQPAISGGFPDRPHVWAPWVREACERRPGPGTTPLRAGPAGRGVGTVSAPFLPQPVEGSPVPGAPTYRPLPHFAEAFPGLRRLSPAVHIPSSGPPGQPRGSPSPRGEPQCSGCGEPPWAGEAGAGPPPRPRSDPPGHRETAWRGHCVAELWTRRLGSSLQLGCRGPVGASEGGAWIFLLGLWWYFHVGLAEALGCRQSWDGPGPSGSPPGALLCQPSQRGLRPQL